MKSVRAAYLTLLFPAVVAPSFLAAQSAPPSSVEKSAAPSAASPSNSEIAALRQKAERGNAIAQYNLGLAYAQGVKVPADPIEAFVWLTLASDGGSTGKALDTLLGTMNAPQIAEGRKRIDALRSSNPYLRAAPPPASRNAAPKAAAAPAVTPPPQPATDTSRGGAATAPQ